MRLVKGSIEDVLYFDCSFSEDNRGNFIKILNSSDLATKLPFEIKEIFTSFSTKGVVRGIHLMVAPAESWRFVSVIQGSVHDVLLDLRKRYSNTGVPSGLLMQEQELNAKGISSVLIPPGVAHAFQALIDCQMLYITSQPYSKELDLSFNPQTAGIEWPLPITEISKRDACAPSIWDYL